MSNADYELTASSVGFAAMIKMDNALSHLDTTIDYTDFSFDDVDPIVPGAALLMDEEIMVVDTVGIRTFTVKRGCADTIPATHAAGSLGWIMDGAGYDEVEHSAGETISVKVQPFTMGGGVYPIGSDAPEKVDFVWRFYRPYPPAYVFANNARWFNGAAITDTTGSLNLTWRQRNRILQADQLAGHDDDNMTPETGTTYTLRVYQAVDGVPVLRRTEPGIVGTGHMYLLSKALHDFGYPSTPQDGYATLMSERDEMESLNMYTIPLHVEPSANPIESVWQNFWQYCSEAPYLFNLHHGIPGDEHRNFAVASRPGDRMSDGYNLMRHWIEYVDNVDGQGNHYTTEVPHVDLVATGEFTPWFTLEFGITELETTINVAATSLWDGIRVPPMSDLTGKIALIEQEYVIFKQKNGDVYTIGRGVGDTIPARHIAGIGVVFFDNVAVVDPVGRYDTAKYSLQPLTYGPLPDPNLLPLNTVPYNFRVARPYNVGQLVVNGRPFYEEAQATTGQPVVITWAWRNRITQGAVPYDHAFPSFSPEPGTQCVFTFFYQTPPVNPGDPPVQHDLRTVVVNPVYPTPGADANQGIFQYTYAMAQADGAVAGAALGVCGSVVITCAVYCLRDGIFPSLQHYWIPIRVPSYPCA